MENEKIEKLFDYKFLTANEMLNKYINSNFFKIKYYTKDELFKLLEVKICYLYDMDINENLQEVLNNLNKEFFEDKFKVSFSIMSFKQDSYLIIPQSYFLDKNIFNKRYKSIKVKF